MVPATTPAADVLALRPDGVFLSNGPGDPEPCAYAVENIRALLGRVPIFGICLGHQLLGLALGGKTYKLKFGHHGGNHPVRDQPSGRIEITAQNHDFAVDPDSLPSAEVELTHLNLNDGTLEGLRHRSLPLFSVQYHPEAAPGPHDAHYLFADFMRMMAEPAIMPRRTDIQKVLILGSGPIVIGQACEFDYSGTQACKALRDEGFEVVLVNSNPATIMTDPELADRTYIEPLTRAYVAKILERECEPRGRMALLPTVGGQTALNLAVELADAGVLERYGVAPHRRQPRGHPEGRGPAAVQGRHEGHRAGDAALAPGQQPARRPRVRGSSYPVIIRPSFTLGGSGGGLAYNREEFAAMLVRGLDLSPVHEVLVEETVLGWKEYELEVMRDHADNVVIVCSIENLDPMGVHTGDSITVAPAQTLTDREYQAHARRLHRASSARSGSRPAAATSSSPSTPATAAWW